MSIQHQRLAVEPAPRPGNAAIRQRYPIDHGTWVFHPDSLDGQRALVRFALDLTSEQDESLVFDMSADQRYILYCDGIEVGRGPDRSELGGWSFHRYQLQLPAGEHHLEVSCWWLRENERPIAQVSAKPGFALVGIDQAAARLNTGQAPWQVCKEQCWDTRKPVRELGYHVIGWEFHCDGHIANGPWREPVVVAKTWDDINGVVCTPWRCEPSPLPEQQRELVSGGAIRCVQHDLEPLITAETVAGQFSALTKGESVTVAAGSTVQILWDFADYVCGYPRLHLAQGGGSKISIAWAESLFEGEGQARQTHKGDRAACAGKNWLGFGDSIAHPGGERAYDIPWWRSGRWLRLCIETGDEDLVILDARPLRTNYPFTRNWQFSCDRPLNKVLTICESGLRNSVHETFVDCPYYEQMQYVGDTRVQALAWLTSSGDPRPVQRALQLFDRSRWFNGFVAERAPTGAVQMSATYSLIQPAILRDYAMWVDDPDTVRRLLAGSRSALEHALSCLDDQGLPSLLPGWLFVDWVKQDNWLRGVPGATKEANTPSLSAPIALHLPVALEAMARVEDFYGEEVLATRYRHYAAALIERILAVFGDEERGLIADDTAHSMWSEHAQALALDCNCLPEVWRERCLDALTNPSPDLAKASVYFSHHVHEALVRGNSIEAFFKRLAFWDDLATNGFFTTVEEPEPARSDCHGWGAHPLYHCLSGLAGIRPNSAAFATVSINPRFGPLTYITASLPHPQGSVSVDFKRNGDKLSGTISSPVPGTLNWQGHRLALQAGRQEIRLG